MANGAFGDNWRYVDGFSTDGTGRDTGYVKVSVGSSSGGSGGEGGLLAFPVIFTGFQINLREKIQVLETFNEFVHVYAFGRGVGNATLNGLVLGQRNNPDGAGLKGSLIDVYENQLRARKLAEAGNLAIISGPGDAVVQGVTHTFNFGMTVSEQGGDNVVPWQMELVTAGGRGSSLSTGT